MDENTGMNFSEYMAILSGNTDLLERAKLEKKIAGLEAERKSFYQDKHEQEEKREYLLKENERHERNIRDAREDLEAFNKARRLNADGSVYNDITLLRYNVPAGEDRLKAIGTELFRIDRETQTDGNYKTIGSIYGFQLLVKTVIAGKIEDKPIYENRFYVKRGWMIWTYESGKLNHTSARLSAGFPLLALQRIPEVISGWESEMEKNRMRIGQLDAIAVKTWGKETQLTALRTELQALDRKINEELHSDKQEAPQPLAQAA